MNTAEELLDDLITLEVFHQQTKITKKAVYEKISKGVWVEGKEFFRDPQRRIWISQIQRDPAARLDAYPVQYPGQTDYPRKDHRSARSGHYPIQGQKPKGTQQKPV